MTLNPRWRRKMGWRTRCPLIRAGGGRYMAQFFPESTATVCIQTEKWKPMQLVLRITISFPCATTRQINPFDPLWLFVMQPEMPFRLEMLPEGDKLLSDFEVGPSIGPVLGGIASASGRRPCPFGKSHETPSEDGWAVGMKSGAMSRIVDHGQRTLIFILFTTQNRTYNVSTTAIIDSKT